MECDLCKKTFEEEQPFIFACDDCEATFKLREHEITSLTSERDSLRKRMEELERELSNKQCVIDALKPIVQAWYAVRQHYDDLGTSSERMVWIEVRRQSQHLDIIKDEHVPVRIFDQAQPAPHEGEEG